MHTPDEGGVEADGTQGVGVQLQAAGVVADDVTDLVREYVVLVQSGRSLLVEEEVRGGRLQADSARCVDRAERVQGPEDDGTAALLRHGVTEVPGVEAVGQPERVHALLALATKPLKVHVRS